MNRQLVVVPLDTLEEIIDNMVNKILAMKNFHKVEEGGPKDENILLTRKETAKLLRISIATLDNWTREEKLIKHRIGNAVRYNKKEVLESFSTLQKYKR